MSFSNERTFRFRDLWIVGFPLLGHFFLTVFRFSLGVLIPEIMYEFSLSEVEVGGILSTYFAVLAMVMALGGYASDRLGRKVIMGLSSTVMAFGILLFAFSTTFNFLVASLVIVGIGAGSYIPTLFAYVGEVLPSSRGFLSGVTHSAYAFGGFLGPSLIGFLIEGYGWRIPVQIFGVLVLISSAAVWSIPYTRRKPAHRVKISIRSILSDRRIVIIAVAFAVCNMGFVSSTLWIPKFLVDIDGFSIASSGLTLGLYSLSGGVGAIVIGWLSDRLGRLRITAIASITAAFLGLTYYLSMGYPYAARIAFSAVLGFFSYAYLSLSVAAAQDLTDPSILGSVTGVVQNIAFISLPIGPILSGVLIAYTEISYALAMSISLPFIVHGIVFSLLSVRGFKRV